MKENPKLPTSFLESNPWQKKSHPIWPATTFTLKRNIARFNFPSRLSKDEMNRLIPLLAGVHTRVLGKETPFYPAEELSVLEKEFLYEHFLCEESFQNASTGQGMSVALDSHFLGLFNIGDHLHMQWVDCNDTWEETWSKLATLEKEIGQELAYAFSPKFGYLTSKVAECGTALSVCAYLHIPALIHTGQLQALLQNLEDVRAFGMEGTIEHLLGDFLLLKNSFTLGVSEEAILRSVHLAAMKLVGAEQSARKTMIERSDAVVKDLISRAYGLLVHSYQLNTRETLSALSMIKFGIDLGWVSGLTDQEVNTLFLQVRRAHLFHLVENPEQDPQAVQRQRAAFVHKRLKNVQLKEVLQ